MIGGGRGRGKQKPPNESSFRMRTPIKQSGLFFKGTRKVEPADTNNKGGAILGKVAGLAAKGIGKGVLKVGTVAAKGAATGVKVGKLAGKRIAKSLRTIGKKTGKSFRNSYTNQESDMRNFKQRPRNLRITQHRRNNYNNDNNYNNVDNVNNSPYEASYNQLTKKYLCNPRKLEVILPNNRPRPSIVAKLKNVYYNIPIRKGTKPGSSVTFIQPTPPINNVGQTPICHTKEKPTIVNHIPGYTAKSTFMFNTLKKGLKGLSTGINSNILKKHLSESDININIIKNRLRIANNAMPWLNRLSPETIQRLARATARKSGINANTIENSEELIKTISRESGINLNTAKNTITKGLLRAKSLENTNSINVAQNNSVKGKGTRGLSSITSKMPSLPTSKYVGKTLRRLKSSIPSARNLMPTSKGIKDTLGMMTPSLSLI